MPSHVIVVERRSDFRWADPHGRVLTMDQYVAEPAEMQSRSRKVINLCRDYDYLGAGYYCSLLAEARGDRVTPSVETILELQKSNLHGERMAAIDRHLGGLADLPGSISALSIRVCFGKVDDPLLADAARRSFELFRCPLLEIDLKRDRGGRAWRTAAVRAIGPRDIEPARDGLLVSALETFSRRVWRPALVDSAPRMDLAILYDPQDPMPPSKPSTLRKFATVGAELGIAVELIEKRDFARLPQFDALFIRETTAIPHHTFRFARKAAAEGMPVIDDPTSMLRCTNKAFLADLLCRNGVPTPATRLVTKRSAADIADRLIFPAVVKIPDGSFSRGVKRAQNRADFLAIAHEMLKESEIILVQEFLRSDFDWRVGVLGGEPIFVARYYMCDQHWQILKHAPDGSHVEGRTEAVTIADTPACVLKAALDAARLIGNGLYGVDLKQTDRGVFVIEVNDNPNIDVGMEDAAAGDALYRAILGHFLQRVEARFRSGEARAPAGPASPSLPLRPEPVVVAEVR